MGLAEVVASLTQVRTPIELRPFLAALVLAVTVATVGAACSSSDGEQSASTESETTADATGAPAGDGAEAADFDTDGFQAAPDVVVPTSGNPCATDPYPLPVVPEQLDPAARAEYEAALTPAVTDESGYALTPTDAEAVGLTPAELRDWRARTAPVGFTAAQYGEFVQTLFAAAIADGLRPSAVDTRLKGSLTTLFSGPHKPFPKDPAAAAETFFKENGEWPKPFWCTQIYRRYAAWFGDVAARPGQRPVDSMFTLDVTTGLSDIDVQLSSDEIRDGVTSTYESDPALQQFVKDLVNPRAGFYDRTVFAAAYPNLTAWSDDWSDTLGRRVAIASFDARGPQNEQSRFKPTDWVVPSPVG